jgi:hypothetical protein
MLTTVIDWLNAETENDTRITLQRDGIYALLSWRDFNQPPVPLFTMRTAAWLFVFGMAIPLWVLA